MSDRISLCLIMSDRIRLRPIMSDRISLHPITSDRVEVHFNNVDGFLDVDVLNGDILTFNLLRTFEDQPGASGIMHFTAVIYKFS